MITRISCLILFVALFTVTHVDSQDIPRERLNEELLKLIYGNSDYYTKEQRNEWLNALRTRPGLVDEALKHLSRVLDGKEDGQPEDVLYAIAQRPDLSKHEETELINRLETFTNGQLPKRGTREFEFALGLLFVLERGIDPRCEQIAIKLMNSQNPDADFCAAGSLRVMKRVGGTASLEAIKAYVKRKFGDRPEKVIGYRDFAEAEISIKSRLASTSTVVVTPPRQVTNPTAQRSATKVSAEGHPQSQGEDYSTPWSVAVMLIIAAIGLLWLILKRRVK